MFTAELSFDILREGDEEKRDDAINLLLGSLRQNGQVLGKEFWFARDGGAMRGFLDLPAVDALASSHNNTYVTNRLSELEEAGLSRPVVCVFKDEGNKQEQAEPPQSYILFTHYLTVESPLCSGASFRPLPLYTIPPADGRDDYYDILGWQSDYQACDTLQMNCHTGERFARRQMSKVNSSLSKRGRALCDQITALTTLPTYYSLHRYKSRTTWEAETARKCPGCGGKWLSDKPWHIFEFRCDGCRLISYRSGGV